MSRMPPPRPPALPSPFVLFACPDGRCIYVRRDAVNVVYDRSALAVECVVATATSAMPVPYTADQAMEILYGDAG